MTTYPSNAYQLKVKSTTNADANTYVARLTNTASYQSQNFQPYIEFNVVVTDPCLTTVITPFTIGTGSPGTITQKAGDTVET